MSGQEVQVSKSQSLAFKISQCAGLLQVNKEVTISAINSAISSAVNLAELLKHRIKNLYQENRFERVDNTSKTRLVIILSLVPLAVNQTGSQLPIPEADVIEKSLEDLKKLPWEVEGAEPRPPRAERTEGYSRGQRDSRGSRGYRRSNRRRPRGTETGERELKEETKDETREENKEERVEEGRGFGRSRRGNFGGRRGNEARGRYGRGRIGRGRRDFNRPRGQGFGSGERHEEPTEQRTENEWGDAAVSRRSDRGGRRFRRPRGRGENTRTGENPTTGEE